ncbi:hypothetical protein Sjap_017562 [Stephania japonica]|uniref:Uncharacterized protein n=1 Tax=Stephania japonica TaxID=461633 RepID=A0AAP0I6E0_9MAGN
MVERNTGALTNRESNSSEEGDDAYVAGTPEGVAEAGNLLNANEDVNKSGNGSNSVSLVLGDPELLDCNIYLEPLTPPVFQVEPIHHGTTPPIS